MVIKPDLSVNVGGIALQNPVMSASGTFGYGQEFASFVNLREIGAIVAKGISLAPRAGNAPPRVVETSAGMLNAIGLENVGVKRFLEEKMPFLREIGTRIIVNILGDSLDEYKELAGHFSEGMGIDALEVNISCPNVKKGGVAFGTNARMAAEVTAAVKTACNLPVIVKLSPNVTDITEIAKAVEAGGADAVSLINTLLGMVIDIHSRRPKLANVVGGLSGPAIKPIALRMVWQVARCVKIPVVGIGGISNADDAIEFLIAGASAIQVGTMNFVNPQATTDIVKGIRDYMEAYQIKSVQEIIGSMNIS